MKFKSYNEIENSYNKKIIQKLREQNFDNPDIEYVCELKIDGSNFQCSIDENDNFIVGSRTSIIDRDDSFHNYRRAMKNEDVENKLHLMKRIIQVDSKIKFAEEGNFVLTVYGELCGGMYRHPDVPKVKESVKIQGRVDYHPDNMWIPFDIVIREPGEENKTIFIVNQDDVVKYCKMVDLPYPIILFKGTFDQCLNYPVENLVDTTGNILWNLPIIEDNIAEGVVIKPNKAMWMRNGQRVIIKNKNNKFKERLCKGPKTKKEKLPLTELELKYLDIADEFITESRLMSVVSKVGTIDNDKQFGKFLGMFLQDLWKDFDKDYLDEIKQLEVNIEVEQFNFSKVKKEISKLVAEFIRPKFIELINSSTSIED